MAILHVAITGSDTADGSAEQPLRTIDTAAQLARPGDTVVVHEGEYREWVKPRRSGLSHTRRITYEAAAGEHVVIKGSERISDWQRVEGQVWKVEIDNAFFGPFNPYAEQVAGDWIYDAEGLPAKHLGEVYLNGRSFYEVASLAEVLAPPRRETVVDPWTKRAVPVPDPDQTSHVWTAEVGPSLTTIIANFQGADPNQELVEINVRRSVFYPVEHYRNYITVRGFELAHAASPWSPPTADQPGLIGPNWAKGWIIEDNLIHDAKCSAISIGKEISTGHNYWTDRGDKPGYQYQLESVFTARSLGWDREHVGSHLIRRNTIYDCGQNGIVGHLGCAFSIIEDNHIHGIATKREFYGFEIGGIKLHAAIDVQILHNRIHDCTLGTWLDWQTQGTRVSRNLYYDNVRDLFVEVSHGPYVVDHNVLASARSLEVMSQGGAFVNNLICGSVHRAPETDRATPYHLPHSTQVAGFAVVYGGDDRYLGNVFLGIEPAGSAGEANGEGWAGRGISGYGTSGYDEHPASFEEYVGLIADQPWGTHLRFIGVRQPVYISCNVYAGAAQPYAREEGAVRLEGEASATVVEREDGVFLDARLPAGFDLARIGVIAAGDLPRARLVDADYEEPDGTPVDLRTDLIGERRSAAGAPGPIASLVAGNTTTRVW